MVPYNKLSMVIQGWKSEADNTFCKGRVAMQVYMQLQHCNGIIIESQYYCFLMQVTPAVMHWFQSWFVLCGYDWAVGIECGCDWDGGY